MQSPGTQRKPNGRSMQRIREGGDGVRTGAGAVKRGGGSGTEGCVFAGCLSGETRRGREIE